MELFELSNYAWNLYGFPPAVVGVGIAFLGLAVLLREQGSPVSMAFFGMSLEGAVWLLGNAGIYFSREPSVALQWARIENIGVVFIPSTVFLFTLAVIGRLHAFRALTLAAWGVSNLFCFGVLFTPWFVVSMKKFFWGYYAQYGPLSIPFFIFFFSLMIVSLVCFWRGYRRASLGTQKRRLGTFLLAFGIAYLGSVDFIATFGIPLYPFGYAPVLIFLVIVAQTIWRYRLVEITPAFAAAQVLKTVSDALLVFDREGVVRVANQAACNLFERPEGQLIGQPIWLVDGNFFPREKFEAFIRTQVIHNYEVVRHSSRGRKSVLEVAISGIRDEFGEPAAVVCVARDLTERKLAEEELQRVHEALKRSQRPQKPHPAD